MTLGAPGTYARSSAAFARVYPRRIAGGLLVSTGIHLTAIVALAVLAAGPAGTLRIVREPTFIDRPPRTAGELLPPPLIPAPAAPRTATPDRAIPVAVPDDAAGPEATIPRQDEHPGPAAPEGAGGSGEGTGETGAGPGEGTLEGIGAEEPPVFEVVEHIPVPIRPVTPEYPAVARLAGLEGTVYLSLLVDREGRVKKVKVLRTDNEVFNGPSIAAAMQWIFRPGETGGGTVATWVTVPFHFRLKNR